jgi:hypothetical protein
MSSSLISLPIWIPNGLGASDGIARVHENELVLEFEVRDGVFGLLKLGVKEISVPFTDIESVSFETGLFNDDLIVATKTLSSTSGIPGARRGVITLCVSRGDRKRAREAESLLAFGLARRDLGGMRSEPNRYHEGR